MKNYEAEKLKKIIKAKEEAMVTQVAETDELRKELTKLKSSLLYSKDDIIGFLFAFVKMYPLHRGCQIMGCDINKFIETNKIK